MDIRLDRIDRIQIAHVFRARGYSVCWNRCLDCPGKIFRVKAEWTGFALVQNSAAVPNQVEPVGPAGICKLRLVLKTVNHRGEFDPQLAHARTGNKGAFRLVLGAAEENSIAHVGLQLPHVGGMRLKNVNGVEVDLAAVLLGEFIQGGNLPPKRRSRVTPEDQNDRLVGPEGRQVGWRVIFKLVYHQARSRIAHA